MNKEYYERIAVIARHILNRVNEFSPDVTLQDNLSSAISMGPNPYRPSIDDDGSLLLEFSYGLPSRFYTPLGGFDFCGEGIMREGKYFIGAKLVSELIQQFDLQEIIPSNKTGSPHVGPIFSVGNDLFGKEFAESNVTKMPEGADINAIIDFDSRNKQWDDLRPDLQEITKIAREAAENIEAD